MSNVIWKIKVRMLNFNINLAQNEFAYCHNPLLDMDLLVRYPYKKSILFGGLQMNNTGMPKTTEAKKMDNNMGIIISNS